MSISYSSVERSSGNAIRNAKRKRATLPVFDLMPSPMRIFDYVSLDVKRALGAHLEFSRLAFNSRRVRRRRDATNPAGSDCGVRRTHSATTASKSPTKSERSPQSSDWKIYTNRLRAEGGGESKGCADTSTIKNLPKSDYCKQITVGVRRERQPSGDRRRSGPTVAVSITSLINRPRHYPWPTLDNQM